MGFLLGVITTSAFLMLYFFFVPGPVETKTLRCSNKNTKIGVVIDEKNHKFLMAGQELDEERIKVFSEIVIEAKWEHNRGTTHVSLDRLTGEMEITETGNFMGDKKVQTFDCRHITQRF